MRRKIETLSSKETFELGERIGHNLKGGEVVCLYGELGAGKTVLAKGLSKGLGVKEEITSPTFTLIQEYDIGEGELRLIHMDLYRLKYPEEAEIIGVTDYFKPGCICLLEWPGLIEDLLPEDRLDITIEGSGDTTRSIMLSHKGEQSQLLDSIL